MADRVAVLAMTYGEIEDYSEFDDYNERSIRLLVSKTVSFPEWVIPRMSRLLGRRARKEWEAHGHFESPNNAIFERQCEGLAKRFEEAYGDRVGVFKAYNFCPPDLPEDVVPRIREAGYDGLLVYPLEVVDGVFTGGLAIEQVNEAVGDASWISGFRYVPSFAQREDYHALLVDHIERGIADLRSRYYPGHIGIVLLMHGCPLSAKGWDTGQKDSEALYEAVRNRLVQRYPLISPGWMNHPTPGKWTTSDMETASKQLITLGAKALVYVPIGFVTDNHETLLDVDHVGDEVKGRVEILHLPSLNDDPAFLDAAAGWVRPLIDEMLGSEAD
jgi:ferrochelatase